MEKVWILRRSYENFDNDDILSDSQVYVHKTREGALKHFEELKPGLELWIYDEDEIDEYVNNETYVYLNYGGVRNVLYLYEDEVLE